MNTMKSVRVPRLSMGGAMLLLAALFASSCSKAADPKDLVVPEGEKML